MNIISNTLIVIVGLLHIGFFVLERFLWTTPVGHKLFRMTAEQAKLTANLAGNQAIYNLLLALGLFWALSASNTESRRSIQVYILIFIMICGIYGAITVSKSILFLQTLPALLALLSIMALLAQPRMNDITTHPEQPTAFKALNRKPYNTKFIALQKKYYPEVKPLVLNSSSDTVYKKIIDHITHNTSWKIVSSDAQLKFIEATEQTKFFRFTDDIVIEVQDNNPSSIVQMRSRSRMGQSDFGVNAKRILNFFAELNNSTN